MLGDIYLSRNWLPPGKQAAIIFSIDDIHPAGWDAHYEAGGGLEHGVLGRTDRLLKRHPKLQALLMVTPDSRLRAPYANPWQQLARYIPGLNQCMHAARVHKAGTYRIDHHPEFVDYVRMQPRMSVAMHGYQHVSGGSRYALEFENLDDEQCLQRIEAGKAIFDASQLNISKGFASPASALRGPLIRALQKAEFEYIFSARDLHTPITERSKTLGSGLRGAALIHPQRIENTDIIHFPTNFQATSSADRAFSILDAGGLLSVKAHAFKYAFKHIQADGLDGLYGNFLDLLFSRLEDRYGDGLWWTSPAAIAARINDSQASCNTPTEHPHNTIATAAA